MRRRDEGSGTVLVLALVAVAVVLAAAAGTLGRARAVRAEAQVAADLAALAAAGSVALPPGVRATTAALDMADPCGLAAVVCEANGGRLERCRADPDGVVAVRVTVADGHGPLRLAATADARAGPAGAR